jgi:predicted nucleic acid-binding Zn ribbon protein
MKPLAHAVPGALTDLLRMTPMSPAKIDFAWKAVVGAAMQRVTSVRLENRLLLVEAASEQWGREVSRSSRVILTRLQTLLGEDVVTRIEVRRA